MQPHEHVIVVGIDFSPLGDRALHKAYELAALRSGSEIHAVTVVEVRSTATRYGTLPAPESVGFEHGVARITQHVSALLAKVDGFPRSDVRVYPHFRVDKPVVGITQLASELQAELIVVGTNGRCGMARWLLGSVAEGVVRQATCPVLLIPPDPSAALSELSRAGRSLPFVTG